VVWLVLAIVSFVAFVILANNSSEKNATLSFHFFAEEFDELPFPRFRFRLRTSGPERFNSSVLCVHNQGAILTSPCPGLEPHTCISVNTDGLIAYNRADAGPDNQRVKCSFQTNGLSNNENLLVHFELEGNDIANWGGALRDSILFGPSSDAWILLSKSWVKFHDSQAQQEWRKQLVYHSTESVNGYYNVEIILNSFRVRYLEQRSAYDGWMALGGSGGFAYFMLMLHVLVMCVVGVAMNNDSRFLASKGDTVPYEHIPAPGSAENRVY